MITLSVILPVCCRMPGFTKLGFQVTTEHATALLHSFSELRQCGSILSDCTLSVSGTEFPVHRCFLAACSPYFRTLFTSKMKERTCSLIKIRGVEADTFQLILGFLYSGQISLNENNVTELYPAAKLFQLELLQKVCCDYFMNQLCTSNCVGIWKYARTYNDCFLEKSAWDYLTAHFMELIGHEEFLSLESSNLRTILSSDELELSSEMDSYSAVMIWLQHDLSSRKKDILSLISCVRFPLLSLSSLNSLLSKDVILTSDRKLKDVLIQAKNAQRLRSTKSRQRSTHAFHKTNLTPRKSKRNLSVIGGYSGHFVKICESYDDTTDHWEINEYLELSPCEHVHWIGVIGYRIYTIGGNSLTNINLIVSKFIPYASNLLQTSALSKEWECEATLPSDCSSMQFCTMDECIYGCGQTLLEGALVYGIIRYDPGSGNLEYLTTLPTPRVSISFLAYDGTLFLIGGMNPNTSAVLTLFEGYNPNSNTWQSYPSLKIGRYHLGTAALDGHIYAFGGIGDSEGEINTQLKSVEFFSLNSRQWSSVKPLPSARAAMASCTWREKIYCIGGETAEDVHTRDVFSFSPVDEVWVECKPLKHSRIHPNVIIT